MMFVVEPSYEFFFMFNGELDDDDLTLHMVCESESDSITTHNAGWRYSAQITQTEIID